MRLGISHRAYRRQTVGHHRPHLPNVPVVVAPLLEYLNPVVGDGHAEAVVEAHAAILGLHARARHAADILGYGYGVGAQVVDELVCQGEVDDGIAVDTLVEEALAAVEIHISVVVVEHRCHSIEAVAVEMELLNPVFHVRE